MPRPRFVRPALDPLDARTVPATGPNLTVTFSALTHTLTVVGDAGNNEVTVQADPADHTHFTLTSSGTINGQPSPYSTPAGVRNLAFRMLDGDDTVLFDGTNPITVEGGVTINNGNGANTVAAGDLTVTRNLSVTNGTATAGPIRTLLTNLSVGGNVTLRSAGGDTLTYVVRNAPGVSTIHGNLTVTNGTGVDYFQMTDTNIDHNVTINNGHGGGGSAGSVDILNQANAAFRSVIGGNLTVTYRDGNGAGYDGLWDTAVLGNVTFNHGPGAFVTRIDGFRTHLPVYVRGNLSVLGTGANSVDIGKGAQFGTNTGLTVGGRFTLRSGGGTAEHLTAFNLDVGGGTALALNNGGNTVSIDDSVFDGPFALSSGAGFDTVSLETTGGTSAATVFRRAVTINLGAGIDRINYVYDGTNLASIDSGEAIVFWGPLTVRTHPELFLDRTSVFFPNGGQVL
jgi:hypothetical protein